MAVGVLGDGETIFGWENTDFGNDCPGDDEIWPNPTTSAAAKPRLSVWLSGKKLEY